MPKIKQLDSITISKIAAGEVIDRPVSIVKELIENSLDAHATRISVIIEDGGKQRISITDNGIGIDKEELILAATQHATSKITTLDDIYDVHSFGFRGEALSSIAHVAKLDITSNTGETAYTVRAHNQDISLPSPTSHPKGTTTTVHDLFFDIPVRRKFLKTATTELSHITDVVIQFALINPTVEFILTSNGKEVINTTGISTLPSLVIHLYGKSFKDHLIPIDTTVGPIQFTGITTAPTHTFSNRSKQVIAVNNRLVKSGVIQKAIGQSYRDLIPHNRHPLLILNISMNHADIDVNIHPQKQDIKFLSPGFIFDSLPKALSFAFQSHKHPNTSEIPQLDTETQSSPYSIPKVSFQIQDSSFPAYQSSPNVSLEAINACYQPLSSTQERTTVTETPLPIPNMPLPAPDYLQVYNTYIVIKGPDGALWILDQHAVHERILYEQFKQSFEASVPTKQVLLIPEVIDLSISDYQQLEDHQSTFEQLGFVIEPFGPQQVIIREIPNPFTNCQAKVLVLDLLEQFKTVPDATKDLTLALKETLQMKACKAAIKAGKVMQPEEVQQLLTDLINCPSNFTCPHGRPLVIKLNQSKLESIFNRS